MHEALYVTLSRALSTTSHLGDNYLVQFSLFVKSFWLVRVDLYLTRDISRPLYVCVCLYVLACVCVCACARVYCIRCNQVTHNQTGPTGESPVSVWYIYVTQGDSTACVGCVRFLLQLCQTISVIFLQC